jgi:YD repeat-containing protein
VGSGFVKKHQKAKISDRQLESGAAIPPKGNPAKKPEGKILKEITDKRERNVKHFLKDDLTFEAAVYNKPVHYFSDGLWKDIDNSMIEGKDDENNNVLENKNNDFKVKIAKKAIGGKLVTIAKDKYEISWGIEKAGNADAEIKDKSQLRYRGKRKSKHKSSDQVQYRQNTDESTQLQNIENQKVTNLESTIEFSNIYPNMDLQYSVNSDELKETFIIKDKVNDPVIDFNVGVKNLTAAVQEDKSIIFYDQSDDSKVVFKIETPFMYDGNGSFSKDVQVIFGKSDTGYKLVWTPDNEWLNDKARKYPVVIDPTVKTPIDVNSIQDSFIGSNIPNQNNWQSILLGVGKGTSSGTTRSFVKFTLPQLTSADFIIKANLYLNLYTANYNVRQINVHKVRQDWSSGSITWNNQPQFDSSKIEDYQMVQGDAGALITWDVTSMVKGWYDADANYGLVLKNNDESVGYNEFISSDIGSEYEQGRPQVIINYVNNSGLEDYWTYHSQDVRRAGTGYINDHNGNLIYIHDDLIMSGNKMPLTLKHVFNSNEKDKNAFGDGGSTVGNYGLGWRLNLSQKIDGLTVEGVQWYAYTDEDGSRIYFSYDSSSGTYKQEMGTDFTFTKNADGSYSIKDKDGGTTDFTNTGYLYKVRDKNDNAITLSYDGAILKKITDGAGRVTSLNVLGNGYLVGITDPAGRRTSFEYNGAQLYKITYPDGKYSIFLYDSSNKLLSAVNHDGYKITYSYYSQSPYRVSKAEEFGTDGVLGGSLNISYGYNTTVFVDGKGRKNVYQFNDYGNTVSVRDDDESAEYYKYLGENLSNKLSLESRLQKFSKNYLRNHNAEISKSDWIVDYWTGSQGSGEFTTEDFYMGNSSLKLIKDNSVSRHFYSQQLQLPRGKNYTFSAYMKTKNISNVNGKGAALFVNYTDKNGVLQTVESRMITGNSNWRRYEVEFTLPADARDDTVYARAGIIMENGTAYFDCLQLEEGPVANRYNLIENGDLSYGQPVPAFWYKNTDTDEGDKVTALEGKTAFQINGSSSKSKYLYQKVNVSGKSGDTLVFSGWAKGFSVPLAEGRRFSLEVGLLKTDDTYEWNRVSFNEDSTDWQYISDYIVAKNDFKSAAIYAEYYNNANSAYFTNFSLYKEEFGWSYTYDEKGNVVSTVDISKKKSTFEYDAKNQLIKAINPSGGEFKYDRDTKGNITKATSASNVVYSFSYDSSGNPIKGSVGDTAVFMESTSSYSISGNYLKSLTDGRDNSLINNYDEARGLLTADTDADGSRTNYEYDNMNHITRVSKFTGGRNLEKFPLNSDTAGSRETKTKEENTLFARDESGNMAFAAFKGTTNLLLNSSFENSADYWTLEDWDGSTGSGVLSSDVPDPAYGSSSLQLYDSDGLVNGSGTNMVAYQVITLTSALPAQKAYTLSSYAKRIGSENPEIGVRCFDANGSEISGTYQSYEKAIPENQWTIISNTFIFPAGTKSFFAILRSHAKDNDKIFFDAVQVEEGSMYTPYIRGSRSNSKLYYDLGLDKKSGTMSLWFSTKGSGTRLIFSNENSDALLNLYVNEDNQISLGIISSAGVFQNILTISGVTIEKETRYFAVLKWQLVNGTLNCTVYINGTAYNASVSDFKDFTGVITALGSNAYSNYLLNGFLESFTYTREALNDSDIQLLYAGNLPDDPGTSISNSYSYENDRIKNIAHNGFSYKFQYDRFGNNESVYVGDQILVQNTFEQATGNLLGAVYGGDQNQKLDMAYDNLDRIISRKFNGEERYSYEYDSSGNLGYHEDKVNNRSYRYVYDLADRLVRINESDNSSSALKYTEIGYDKSSNQNKITQQIKGNIYETVYEYDKDNKPLTIFYGRPLEDNEDIEYFELNGSTAGSKGTAPSSETAVFQTDESGETVLSAYPGTKVIYDLDIDRSGGTMTAWISAGGSGSRMIIGNEGSTQLFNLYVDVNDKVNLAVMNSDGVFTNVITTEETIGRDAWEFTALQWSFSSSTGILRCTVYLNSKVYSADVTSFKDFTGVSTIIGSNLSGNYTLNGLIKQFTYSSSPILSGDSILKMYHKEQGGV